MPPRLALVPVLGVAVQAPVQVRVPALESVRVRAQVQVPALEVAVRVQAPVRVLARHMPPVMAL